MENQNNSNNNQNTENTTQQQNTQQSENQLQQQNTNNSNIEGNNKNNTNNSQEPQQQQENPKNTSNNNTQNSQLQQQEQQQQNNSTEKTQENQPQNNNNSGQEQQQEQQQQQQNQSQEQQNSSSNNNNVQTNQSVVQEQQNKLNNSNMQESKVIQDQSQQQQQQDQFDILDENYYELNDQLSQLDLESEGKGQQQVMKIRQQQLALSKFIYNIYERDQQRLVIAHSQLGEAYLEFKCQEQAIDHLTVALKLNGELFNDSIESKVHHTNILKFLGMCYIDIGNIEDAIQILNKAEQIYQNLYSHIPFLTYQAFQKVYDEHNQEQKNGLDEEYANKRMEQLEKEQNENSGKTEDQINKEIEQENQKKEEERRREELEQQNLTEQDKQIADMYAQILALIANCYYIQKNTEEAIQWNDRVIFVCTKIGPFAHKSNAKSCIQLAQIYLDTDINSAIEYQQQAVNSLEGVNDQPEFLAEQYEVLSRYFKQQKEIQAQEDNNSQQYENDSDIQQEKNNSENDGELINLRNVKRIYQQLYGSMDKRVIKLKRQISIILLDNKQHQQALQELIETEEMEKQLYGHNSVQVGKTQKVIGTIYLLIEDTKNSTRYFNMAKMIFEENQMRKPVLEIEQKMEYIRKLNVQKNNSNNNKRKSKVQINEEHEYEEEQQQQQL